MTERVIRGELSAKGIQSIIDQLKDYKDELHKKTELFCKRLAEIGMEAAETHIGESPLGKYVSVRVDMEPLKSGCKAMIVATGENKTSTWRLADGTTKSATIHTHLMVEFGAGVAKNTTVNPKADEFGMGPGTFPDSSHGLDPGGWWWQDADTDEWKHSTGIQATMPMYNAGLAVRLQVAKIAKEVFG